MNFTHFTSTNEDLLPGEPTISLCHDLLRRCAALQLSHDNPAFDQLIPIYFDNGKSPFDRSKCGAIVIQNKNKGAATTPDYIFGEEFIKIDPRVRVGKANKQDPIRQKKTYAFIGMNRPIPFCSCSSIWALSLAALPLFKYHIPLTMAILPCGRSIHEVTQ